VTLERRQRRLLVSAGEPAGLDPWATWALSLLLGGLGLALGALATQGGGGAVLEVVLPLVGLAAPNLRLQALREVRFTAASRDFPVAIELAALAMSAGLDFPGAMRQVTERQRGVAAEELEQVLLALDLGITRAAALRALEERLPVAEVRDLTRAVVLAERKGASVGDALRQVAATSRQRRSVRAEEAAARAGALLLIPLMLLLIAILMLLLGPLLIGGVGL
jgi:tight adherence protein C